MPEYDFRTLSPSDFEQLARDVINARLCLDLHAYAVGADQGIDLRQVESNGKVTVVQCKHYLDSRWSTFMGAVRKEVPKGQALQADRYIFVTSRDLSPQQEDEVVDVLRPLGVSNDEVWARKRINDALALHPEVERRHIKLWLSSAGVLSTLLGAGRWNRGEAAVQDAVDFAKLWVPTEAHHDVLEVLEAEGACIAYGPPGAGKTFLAMMVLLAAVAEGWSPVHVSGGMDDAWQGLEQDGTRQIFYYDDFLGESQLRMEKGEPSQLASFIARIRRLRAHKRFLMTTREHFIAEAAGKYDVLQDLPEDILQIGVRIDRLSPRVKAEILFNHLYFSGLSQAEREALAVDSRIFTIVQHAAYNPRLIERALKSASRRSIDEKLDRIRKAFDHPGWLWRTTFQDLQPLGQQILLALATLPPRPWPVAFVRGLVDVEDTVSWTPTLRALESAWLNISGPPQNKYLTLANPGCRDYLLSVLDDGIVADDQIMRIRSLDQIVSLTHSAGLLPREQQDRPLLPDLADSLTGRRRRLMELVRSFVDAASVGEQLSGAAQIFRDAAALTAVYGTESDADWLVGHIEESVGELPPAAPWALFELAAILAELGTNAPQRRDAAARNVAMLATSAISSIRDLNSYESLPESLRAGAVRDLARQMASRVLTSESEHLLHDADDPDSIRLGVSDIEQRADWYGLHVDTGPLLDRADDLEGDDASDSSWPNSSWEPDEDIASVRQVFSRPED